MRAREHDMRAGRRDGGGGGGGAGGGWWLWLRASRREVGTGAGAGGAVTGAACVGPSGRWKFLRRAVLCFVLGGVVNTLVALGVILFGDWRNSPKSVYTPTAWPVPVPSSWELDPGGEEWSIFGARSRYLDGAHVDPSQTLARWYYVALQSYGWPLYSFRSYRMKEVEPGSGTTLYYKSNRRSLDLSAIGYKRITLPGEILPLGFVVNSALFALPFALLATLPRYLAVRSRRRRGLCVRCRYELAGLTRCPECNTPRFPAGHTG